MRDPNPKYSAWLVGLSPYHAWSKVEGRRSKVEGRRLVDHVFVGILTPIAKV